MRFPTAPCLVAAAIVAAACSDGTAAPTTAADPAVLEVGGTATHAIELVAIVGTGSGAAA